MNANKKIRILFVCMGNICRSPLAEGIFRSLLVQQRLDGQFEIDSAGTSNYHVGDLPDERAIKVAKSVGVNLNHHARQFIPEDFHIFDYILVMDHLNHEAVLSQSSNKDEHEKVFLFRTFDSESTDFQNVPDPYYGGEEDFEEVKEIVIRAGNGFIEFLRATHNL